MKANYFLLLLSLFSNITFAWMCPNNFNQIGVGDSLEQVKAQCGTPVAMTTLEESPNVPQEWRYYIMVSGTSYLLTYTQSTNNTNQATIKMSIAFVNNRAINITVEAQSLSSTNICGPTINVGDTQESIKKSCGDPAFIQKQVNDNVKPTELIELKYTGSSPNILIFENGRLKERK
jgi:hypothetical protein